MKILGSDYDGTLNWGGFNQEKLDAIQRWRDAGNKLGVVSGRGPSMMATIQEEFGLSLDFFVAFNGAVILDCNQNEICKTSCTNVDLKELVQDLFDLGCEFAHVNSDKYYLIQRDKKDLHDGEYLLENVTLPPLLYQVSVVLENKERAAEVVIDIAKKYDKYLTPLLNERCIDIVAKGVNKAQGIRKIRDFYQAREDDIIVVGDNFNDIDMIKAFKSYAMENGVDEVKRIANHTTKSVTDLIKKELGE